MNPSPSSRVCRAWLARLSVVPLCAGLLSACVSKSRFDELAEEQTNTLKEKRADERRIAELEDKVKTAEKTAEERDQKLSQLSVSQHNLQAALDDGTAINAQLRDQIQRLGGDVDKMLKERGTMSSALDDARARLDELRRAQAAAEARAALFRDLAQRFQSMIAVGQLSVGSRRGRLTMTLPGDFLFAPGQAPVKDTGRGALLVIGKQLATVRNHHFEIGVHTDGAPPGGRYASNWDLSAERAAHVVKLFVASGVAPANLAATGYADADPVSDGAPAAQDRRLEIVMRPEAEDLVAVPALAPPAPAPTATP